MIPHLRENRPPILSYRNATGIPDFRILLALPQSRLVFGVTPEEVHAILHFASESLEKARTAANEDSG